MSKEFPEKPPRKHYSRAFKEKVIMHILNGEHLVEELMEIYDIRSRETIIGWLSDYVKKRKGKDS